MPITTKLYGFNVPVMMTDALAQPVGSQKVRYCNDVISRLGANPIFEIKVGSTVCYRSYVVSALSASSAGITLPQQFFEPPSINFAMDLGAGANAELVIRHATNTNIYATTPLRVGGGADHLSITTNLDGTNAVRTSALVLAPPASLDVNAGNVEGTMPLADLFTWMESSSSQPTFGRHNSDNAVNHIPCNHSAIVSAASFQGTSRTTIDTYYDAYSTWLWFYYGQGNQRQDKRLQFRNLKYAVLKNSNGTWQDFPVFNRQSMCQMWFGNRTTEDTNGNRYTENLREEQDGCSVKLTTPDMGAECWPSDFYMAVSRSVMTDAKCMVAFCQVRVIEESLVNGLPVPYTGADAKYTVKLGYDVYYTGQNSAPGTGGPNYGKHHSSGTHNGRGYLTDYPRFLWDGGCGAWRVIDGSMGWVNVGVIAGYTQTFSTVDGIGANPPWGNYTSPSWPYNKSPYCLTKAELEASHPTWLTTGAVTPPPDPSSAVIAVPTITSPGNAKTVGTTLTRVVGTYAAGWTPTAGRWIAGTNNRTIGNQASVETNTVVVGEYVTYIETITHTNGSTLEANSAPFGPFTAAVTPTVMNTAMIDRVINTSTGNGNNEGTLFPFNNTGGGGFPYSWRYGSDWGFGGLFKVNPKETSNLGDATTNNNSGLGYNNDSWNDYPEPWLVFAHSWEGYGGVGEIDVRNMFFQYLVTSTQKWVMAYKNDNTIVWSPRWQLTSGGGQGFAGGDDYEVLKRTGYDTIRIDAPAPNQTSTGPSCHFSMSKGFTYVPSSTFKMYIVGCQVRRGSGSSANHVGMAHVGNDPKYKQGAGDSSLWWSNVNGGNLGAYPNSNVSRSIRLTDQWQDLFAAPIFSPGNVTTERAISPQALRDNPPLYPF